MVGERDEKIRQMRMKISEMCGDGFPEISAMLEVDSTKTDSRMDRLRTNVLDILNA